MLKKILFPLLAVFILAGCAASNNTLNVTPKVVLPPPRPNTDGSDYQY
ncbi:lipoprotein YajG [Yersinia enterocolitica subsp. enterocolitica]|nr:lipoprotein YajG [Yersinia enterocolitica subsp. enterocolitica]